MSKPDNSYWENRAVQREHESYLRGSKLSERLFREYQRAARDIRRKINDFYVRYANENGLTYDEAVRELNRKEMQEWKADIGAYVDAINKQADPGIKAKMKAELDALSYNSQINRLMALEAQINMTLNELFDRGVQQMKEEFADLFTEGYYKKIFDIQQRVGYSYEFAKIDTDMIEDVVSYPWSGANFSDRLWQNKQALLFNIRETITQGLIQGTSIQEMSKQLSNNMGQSYKNAERLIRTETSHFHNEASKRAYKAAGVTEYEYMATLDERTCEKCGPLDGKHFPVAEAKEGENYPAMHPHCRCTTIEYDPEEALDWEKSGQPMPKNITYEEWHNQYVGES